MELEEWLDDNSEQYKNSDCLVIQGVDVDGLHVIGTSREEAEKFIKGQLNSSGEEKKKYKKPSGKWHDSPQAHHYGKCELIDLLDLIYGKKQKEVADERQKHR